jgi:hypothetical protein
MTTDQILNLPEGAIIKRKTVRECEPQYGVVLEEAYNLSTFVVAWGQEGHPLFLDADEEGFREGWRDWRDVRRWLVETVPVYNSHHKTWWRDWKRVA